MTRRMIVPPVLYLPLHADSTAEQQLIEIRALPDGRRALPAYTALDRLADHCGDHQPWVLVKTEELAVLKAAQDFDVVAFDLAVAPDQRREVEADG